MNSEIAVRQIMRPIVSIDSKAKARDAARLMVEKHIGSLVANRDGLPFGMVTERDLMKKILVDGEDPSKVTVGDVMIAPLATIDVSSTAMDAVRRMIEKQVKRLVVTEEKKIVGIVTQTDLIKSLTNFKTLTKLGMA